MGSLPVLSREQCQNLGTKDNPSDPFAGENHGKRKSKIVQKEKERKKGKNGRELEGGVKRYPARSFRKLRTQFIQFYEE